MVIPEHIPEKIHMNLLLDYLELSTMGQEAKLEALKSYSKDSGLLFTFDEALRGMPVDIPINDTYNESGEFKPAKNNVIQCIFKPKSFTLNDYSLHEGKAFACIWQFELGGVGFNIINKGKSNFGSYNVDLSKAYVKRSDFINIFDVSGDNESILASRQEVLKRSIRDQRYEFLYEWTKKTLPSVPFDEFIAKYDIELTKETFYELLSNEYKKNHPNNSNIFVKGADNFYKDKRITLKFKGGRRKNS